MGRDTTAVMPGFMPGIHANTTLDKKTWMAGTSPAMTKEGEDPLPTSPFQGEGRRLHRRGQAISAARTPKGSTTLPSP